MTFKPGQSGNPGGRATEQMVTSALRTAALRKDRKGRTAVQRMSEKVMKEAVKGTAWAVGFVTERLDGKVAQQVDATIGPSAMFLEIIRAVSQKRIPEGLTIDGSATVSGVSEPRKAIAAK